MRTSLFETEQIEAHLLQLSAPGDALVFEAKLLLDDELNETLHWQNVAYNKIKLYGRNQLKQEIEAVHQSLFNKARHKSFSEKIRQIFSKR
ncbi:hypothetical protein [Mucilaginibacter sp.]|uniref:hypothetical protein n=1 Tax=Mucilaginibacter sp. TaxID=1882438 RepID=UPI0025FEC02B|nr:hypothetical protein [Mucilaginibacter sp.]